MTAKGRMVLATVKGDVHDIGKNIVGVVLGCNSYDVVDPVSWCRATRFCLEAVADSKADVLGLSGLITPSLDEMVFVAREMERRGLEGAAADWRRDDQPPAATAVKDPRAEHSGSTVHVLDASRVGDVMSSLLNPAQREQFDSYNRGLQKQLREQHSAVRHVRPLLSAADALDNKLALDWTREPLSTPSFLAVARSTSCSGSRAVHRLDVLLRGVGS